MTKQEAIKHLAELKQNAEDMSRSGCSEDWKKDVEAYEIAIESLKEEHIC